MTKTLHKSIQYRPPAQHVACNTHCSYVATQLPFAQKTTTSNTLKPAHTLKQNSVLAIRVTQSCRPDGCLKSCSRRALRTSAEFCGCGVRRDEPRELGTSILSSVATLHEVPTR